MTTTKNDTREYFESKTAKAGTMAYFEQAMEAGFYGCDDDQQLAFRSIN